MVLSDNKITEIFYFVDEFCLEFEKSIQNHLVGNKPNSKPKMSCSEVITSMIMFHSGGFRNMKHFYIHYVQKHMKHLFGETVSYNRFLELMQGATLPRSLLLKTCCMGDGTGIAFIDSTPIRVGKNKGYISQKLTQVLFMDGLHLITSIRNNMKNALMELKDKIMLRKRSVIETVNDELKNICQIEHSRHRSFTNFIANLSSGLIAYSFFPKKPAIKYDPVNTSQLDIF